MAVIAPNSEIYLIKCPIELDNLNQLSFANATAQHNYFNGLPKLSLTNATFQRKDGTIRWPGSMESILEYNYCMYRNKNHGNKWFYAFITNIEYVSDSMSAITISTDCWQTWQFDITFKPSYIEREHTNDDTVGANTIPEGLDTGPYVCNSLTDMVFADPTTISYTGSWATVKPDLMVCIQLTTLKLRDGGQFVMPSNAKYSYVNSVPQGLHIIAVPLDREYLGNLWTMIGLYDTNGQADALVSMFVLPREITNWTQMTNTGSAENIITFAPADSNTPQSMQFWDSVAEAYKTEITFTGPSTLNGYTPKNNKMKVWPYSFLTVSNNNGADVEFHYEDFRQGTPKFKILGSLEQGGAISCIPTNSYISKASDSSGGNDGWIEGVPGGKFPQVSWKSNYYLNWNAQNGKNIQIQSALSAVGFAFGAGQAIDAATHAHGVDTAVERGYFPWEEKMNVNPGGLLGNVVNFASSVANTQNAIRNAKATPDQARGNGATGTLSYSVAGGKYTVRNMCIKQEYAIAIDSFFSMFGYKTNRMKMPNITGRTNWNYVKTQGCNLIGDVPQGDLQQIKAMFNNGITIWHNPATYLDYSQNNNII
jgi:hypothetical protein